MSHIQRRWVSYAKEPTVQIAHLVFANAQAKPEKTKRAIFCHGSPRIMKIEKWR
jgi:hypothetical protein